MTRRPLILSVFVVALTVFAAAAWYVTRPAPTTAAISSEQSEALIRPYSPVLGPEDAPVTIVEFFDPACEACRAFYPVVKDIMAKHGDAVRTRMLAPDVVAVLNQEVADVESLEVNKTPTFFVNGRMPDPSGEAELRKLVAEQVAAAKS